MSVTPHRTGTSPARTQPVAPKAQTSSSTTHEVKSGESLSQISRKYQVDGKEVGLDTLKQLNPTLERGRGYDLIYPGDKVVLPNGATPVSGTVPSTIPSATTANTLTGAAAAVSREAVENRGQGGTVDTGRTYVNPATGKLVTTSPSRTDATQLAGDTLKQAFNDDNGLTDAERLQFNRLQTPLAPHDNPVDHAGNLQRGYEGDGRGVTAADQRAIDAGTRLDNSIKQAASDGNITEQEMLEINANRVSAMGQVTRAGVVDTLDRVRGPLARQPSAQVNAPDPAATQRAASTLKQAFQDDDGLTRAEQQEFNRLGTPLAPGDNTVNHAGNLQRGYQSDGRGITAADQSAIDAGSLLDATVKNAAEDGTISDQELLEINMRRVETMRKVVEAGIADTTAGVRGPNAR